MDVSSSKTTELFPPDTMDRLRGELHVWLENALVVSLVMNSAGLSRHMKTASLSMLSRTQLLMLIAQILEVPHSMSRESNVICAESYLGLQESPE